MSSKKSDTGKSTICSKCRTETPQEQFEQNLFVCPGCDFHFNIGAQKRLEITLDPGFEVLFEEVRAEDPLKFIDSRPYPERIQEAQDKTGSTDALRVAVGVIEGLPVTMLAMDFFFMGGSMGAVVGERVARGFEYASEHKQPLVAFTCSGGARMQEGMLSLTQMAKTAMMVSRFQETRLPYIVVLTHPTMGGVRASFGSLGDIIFAEPGALIGFSGPRVIEQVTGKKLPKGFQRSGFLIEHGYIDRIVHRKEMRRCLKEILSLVV